MTTTRKQFSFYVEPDVADLLDSLEPGLKTKFINRAIRSAAGIMEPSSSRISWTSPTIGMYTAESGSVDFVTSPVPEQVSPRLTFGSVPSTPKNPVPAPIKSKDELYMSAIERLTEMVQALDQRIARLEKQK